MLACERCGSASTEGARFCQACGASLLPILAPNEERKLISVLVADLVRVYRPGHEVPQQVGVLASVVAFLPIGI